MGTVRLHTIAAAHGADNTDALTDEHGSHGYAGLQYRYVLRHSVGQHVVDQAHTSAIEAFWSTIKLGYHGEYHGMCPAHLQCYVNDFADAGTSARNTRRYKRG